MTDLVSTTLKNLQIDLATLATILAMGMNGQERLMKWQCGALPIPAREIEKLNRLQTGIPYRISGKCFRFIDLFAGIGGMRLPFQELGGECVFTAEWDKFAQATYAANFGTAPEKSGDITTFAADEIPAHDLLLAGFPCQAFSQAGKREGFRDTRGTMFFEIQRILAHHKPAAFLLENVKQLRGHDKGRTLETILATLRGEDAPEIPHDIPMSAEARQSLCTRLDYDTEAVTLKARDFGVPQNRERIYIVGIRRDLGLQDGSVRELFSRVLSERHMTTQRLADILEEDGPYTRSFTISDRLWSGHKRRKCENLRVGKGFGYSLFNRSSEYANTISARYYKDGSEILIEQPDGLNPRKLTPNEARALQGFPKDFRIDMVGKSHIYKQFGNSVAVPVVRAIAVELLGALSCASPPISSGSKVD